MQSKRLMVSIFAWLAAFGSLVAMGGLFAYAGCQPSDTPLPVPHGMAGGGALGIIAAWVASLLVFFNWEVK